MLHRVAVPATPRTESLARLARTPVCFNPPDSRKDCRCRRYIAEPTTRLCSDPHLHSLETQSCPGAQSSCFVHSGFASSSLMHIPPSHTGMRASISLQLSASVHA